MNRRAALALVWLLLAACTSDSKSARAVAERFLDAHYVDIDLPVAEALSAGLAQKKIADERRLVAGQAIDDQTRQPSVYYRLIEEKPEGEDRARFIYRATFTVDGADQLERRIVLVLRRETGAWKVANFDELAP